MATTGKNTPDAQTTEPEPPPPCIEAHVLAPSHGALTVGDRELWFLAHLNTTAKLGNIATTTSRSGQHGVGPKFLSLRAQTEAGVSQVEEAVLTRDTVLTVSYPSHHVLIAVDISPSLAVLRPDTGLLLFDHLLANVLLILEALLRAPVEDGVITISIVGQGVACTDFRTMLACVRLTRAGLSQIQQRLRQQFTILLREIASGDWLGSAADATGETSAPDDRHRQQQSSSQRGWRDTTSSTAPDIAAVLENALFHFRVVGQDTSRSLIFVTDAVQGLPDRGYVDHLINRVSRCDMGIAIVHVEQGDFNGFEEPFGFVHSADTLHHAIECSMRGAFMTGISTSGLRADGSFPLDDECVKQLDEMSLEFFATLLTRRCSLPRPPPIAPAPPPRLATDPAAEVRARDAALQMRKSLEERLHCEIADLLRLRLSQGFRLSAVVLDTDTNVVRATAGSPIPEGAPVDDGPRRPRLLSAEFILDWYQTISVVVRAQSDLAQPPTVLVKTYKRAPHETMRVLLPPQQPAKGAPPAGKDSAQRPKFSFSNELTTLIQGLKSSAKQLQALSLYPTADMQHRDFMGLPVWSALADAKVEDWRRFLRTDVVELLLGEPSSEGLDTTFEDYASTTGGTSPTFPGWLLHSLQQWSGQSSVSASGVLFALFIGRDSGRDIGRRLPFVVVRPAWTTKYLLSLHVGAFQVPLMHRLAAIDKLLENIRTAEAAQFGGKSIEVSVHGGNALEAMAASAGPRSPEPSEASWERGGGVDDMRLLAPPVRGRPLSCLLITEEHLRPTAPSVSSVPREILSSTIVQSSPVLPKYLRAARWVWTLMHAKGISAACRLLVVARRQQGFHVASGSIGGVIDEKPLVMAIPPHDLGDKTISQEDTVVVESGEISGDIDGMANRGRPPPNAPLLLYTLHRENERTLVSTLWMEPRDAKSDNEEMLEATPLFDHVSDLLGKQDTFLVSTVATFDCLHSDAMRVAKRGDLPVCLTDLAPRVEVFRASLSPLTVPRRVSTQKKYQEFVDLRTLLTPDSVMSQRYPAFVVTASVLRDWRRSDIRSGSDAPDSSIPPPTSPPDDDKNGAHAERTDEEEGLDSLLLSNRLLYSTLIEAIGAHTSLEWTPPSRGDDAGNKKTAAAHLANKEGDAKHLNEHDDSDTRYFVVAPESSSLVVVAVASPETQIRQLKRAATHVLRKIESFSRRDEAPVDATPRSVTTDDTRNASDGEAMSEVDRGGDNSDGSDSDGHRSDNRDQDVSMQQDLETAFGFLVEYFPVVRLGVPTGTIQGSILATLLHPQGRPSPVQPLVPVSVLEAQQMAAAEVAADIHDAITESHRAAFMQETFLGVLRGDRVCMHGVPRALYWGAKHTADVELSSLFELLGQHGADPQAVAAMVHDEVNGLLAPVFSPVPDLENTFVLVSTNPWPAPPPPPSSRGASPSVPQPTDTDVTTATPTDDKDGDKDKGQDKDKDKDEEKEGGSKPRASSPPVSRTNSGASGSGASVATDDQLESAPMVGDTASTTPPPGRDDRPKEALFVTVAPLNDPPRLRITCFTRPGEHGHGRQGSVGSSGSSNASRDRSPVSGASKDAMGAEFDLTDPAEDGEELFAEFFDLSEPFRTIMATVFRRVQCRVSLEVLRWLRLRTPETANVVHMVQGLVEDTRWSTELTTRPQMYSLPLTFVGQGGPERFREELLRSGRSLTLGDVEQRYLVAMTDSELTQLKRHQTQQNGVSAANTGEHASTEIVAGSGGGHSSVDATAAAPLSPKQPSVDGGAVGTEEVSMESPNTSMSSLNRTGVNDVSFLSDSGDVAPMWLIVQIIGSELQVLFQPLNDAAPSLAWINTQLGDAFVKTNQRLLLVTLNETRVCPPLLFSRADPDITATTGDDTHDNDQHNGILEPSDFFIMPDRAPLGHFECPAVHEMTFPISDRLDPNDVHRSLGTQALNAFSVIDSPDMFVFVEKAGAVFYLVMSVKRDYHTKPMIHVRVHGVSKPGVEITGTLFKMIQGRCTQLALQHISMLLNRNPLFKLTPDDVAIIAPKGVGPAKSVTMEVDPRVYYSPAAIAHIAQCLLRVMLPLRLHEDDKDDDSAIASGSLAESQVSGLSGHTKETGWVLTGNEGEELARTLWSDREMSFIHNVAPEVAQAPASRQTGGGGGGGGRFNRFSGGGGGGPGPSRNVDRASRGGMQLRQQVVQTTVMLAVMKVTMDDGTAPLRSADQSKNSDASVAGEGNDDDDGINGGAVGDGDGEGAPLEPELPPKDAVKVPWPTQHDAHAVAAAGISGAHTLTIMLWTGGRVREDYLMEQAQTAIKHGVAEFLLESIAFPRTGFPSNDQIQPMVALPCVQLARRVVRVSSPTPTIRSLEVRLRPRLPRWTLRAISIELHWYVISAVAQLSKAFEETLVTSFKFGCEEDWAKVHLVDLPNRASPDSLVQLSSAPSMMESPAFMEGSDQRYVGFCNAVVDNEKRPLRSSRRNPTATANTDSFQPATKRAFYVLDTRPGSVRVVTYNIPSRLVNALRGLLESLSLWSIGRGHILDAILFQKLGLFVFATARELRAPRVIGLISADQDDEQDGATHSTPTQALTLTRHYPLTAHAIDRWGGTRPPIAMIPSVDADVNKSPVEADVEKIVVPSWWLGSDQQNEAQAHFSATSRPDVSLGTALLHTEPAVPLQETPWATLGDPVRRQALHLQNVAFQESVAPAPVYRGHMRLDNVDRRAVLEQYRLNCRYVIGYTANLPIPKPSAKGTGAARRRLGAGRDALVQAFIKDFTAHLEALGFAHFWIEHQNAGGVSQSHTPIFQHKGVGGTAFTPADSSTCSSRGEPVSALDSMGGHGSASQSTQNTPASGLHAKLHDALENIWSSKLTQVFFIRHCATVHADDKPEALVVELGAVGSSVSVILLRGNAPSEVPLAPHRGMSRAQWSKHLRPTPIVYDAALAVLADAITNDSNEQLPVSVIIEAIMEQFGSTPPRGSQSWLGTESISVPLPVGLPLVEFLRLLSVRQEAYDLKATSNPMDSSNPLHVWYLFRTSKSSKRRTSDPDASAHLVVRTPTVTSVLDGETLLDTATMATETVAAQTATVECFFVMRSQSSSSRSDTAATMMEDLTELLAAAAREFATKAKWNRVCPPQATIDAYAGAAQPNDRISGISSVDGGTASRAPSLAGAGGLARQSSDERMVLSGHEPTGVLEDSDIEFLTGMARVPIESIDASLVALFKASFDWPDMLRELSQMHAGTCKISKDAQWLVLSSAERSDLVTMWRAHQGHLRVWFVWATETPKSDKTLAAARLGAQTLGLKQIVGIACRWMWSLM